MQHSTQTDLLDLVTDTHRPDDGQPTLLDALAAEVPA